MIIILKKSNRKFKKWMVCINNRWVHFGDNRYQDYTQHKDIKRKLLYISRHKKNEDWTKSNIMSAGFWSRWLIWEKPTIQDSIKYIESKFNVKIKHTN